MSTVTLKKAVCFTALAVALVPSPLWAQRMGEPTPCPPGTQRTMKIIKPGVPMQVKFVCVAVKKTHPKPKKKTITKRKASPPPKAKR